MDTHSIAFNHIVTSLIILAVAFIISKILRYALNRFVRAASAKLNVDPTKYNFFKNAVSFIVFIVAMMIIFYRIPELKAYGVTLFAGAGVFAAIIGFASQSAFSNIITGIFLVIFKPFRVGDHVSISNNMAGEVEDITLRHTVIRNYENRRIVIPNSVISNETIINSSLNEDETCMYLAIGISYDSNIDLAMKIIQEEAQAHPFFLDRRTAEDIEDNKPAVLVRVIDFGDSSVNLRGYVWAENPIDGFAMKCDLNKSIKERFDKEGIEIPFPHRTIVYKDKK
ncbi:mechanosensitive ion channel family protein [Fulvivirga lutimaris]|uniref:mechanosensitive ion channel family protein n=1 Tax=Fulvivirga lutimaris TaxID=1819566 RepID=UPI0012BC430C|nr:mechanosensitive ion channel family protein [Fulvivirga lutimaris]MTI39399.1 mechanosensitive ion channel family protein [Fulvivirga lutimaris]